MVHARVDVEDSEANKGDARLDILARVLSAPTEVVSLFRPCSNKIDTT